MYIPLFPYPKCCLCYSALHKGHKGWDICSQCVADEIVICKNHGFVHPSELDRDGYTCVCYEGIV